MTSNQATELIDLWGLDYFRELATFGALSDEAIRRLLTAGDIKQCAKGDHRDVSTNAAGEFHIVLRGDIAYYRHCDGHDVLTRHFRSGEQMAFDVMIGLRPNQGVEVVVEDSWVLTLTSDQFFQFHLDCPNEFGLLMINLARELSREIAMLEQVIGESTGWTGRDEPA